MNYIKIAKNSTHSGPGIRVVLYVSGCRNCCPECQNPETWCFGAGAPFTEAALEEILTALDKSWIEGLTLCGGEPMEPENQVGLLEVVKRVRQCLPSKTIWCYTGYELADLQAGGKRNLDITAELLANIDTLITGRYIAELRDITNNNLWRGSTNQKIINLHEKE
jgi:anaerobic ribonucleoside-triphosphate reductase activating protein